MEAQPTESCGEGTWTMVSLGTKQAANKVLLLKYNEKAHRNGGAGGRLNVKSWSLAQFPDLSQSEDPEPIV